MTIIPFLVLTIFASTVWGAISLGCFKDTQDRDLKGLMITIDHNTPEFCNRVCLGLGFRYAGVQYGKECFCGESFGAYGAVPDTDCNKPCTGDGSLTCGGTWAQNIYDVLYIGCYIDKSSRDLEPDWTTTNDNTPVSCIKHCAENGYIFAGVQYAKQCFCGNSYSAHGKAPESECDYPCPADASLTCGGYWRQNIYIVPGRRS
ncbi:hypothetical protein ScPMuIL_002592 [Solemya velum]